VEEDERITMRHTTRRGEAGLSVRRWTLVPLLGLALAMSCGSSASCAHEGRRPTVSVPMKSYLMGRFRFDIPASFQRKPPSLSTHDVKIESVTFPMDIQPSPLERQQSSSRADDMNQRTFWIGHVTEIRKSRSQLDTFEKIVSEKPVPPGHPAVLYHLSNDHNFGLDVLLVDGGRGAVLQTSWVVLSGDETEARERRQSLDRVVAGYRFLSTPAAQPEPGWFYVDGGAVALPYLDEGKPARESMSVGFTDHSTGIEDFHVTSDYPWSPDTRERPGFVKRTLTALTEWSVSVHRMRAGKRVVAGLEGEELLTRSDKEGSVLFGWVHEPEASTRGYVPKIVVELNGNDTHLDEKLGLWDRVLDSIHRLPRE
jgi:hypothetical protein